MQENYLDRFFTKEGTKVASKPMKTCSTLFIMEIQIKTTRNITTHPLYTKKCRVTFFF